MAPNNRWLALALAAGLGGWVAPAAKASVATAASFDEKVENAASIVLGRCVKNESRWDSSGRWILTYSTFDVESTIKGMPAQRVTVVVPGGSVGGLHQSSVGLPSFSEGSENVLFIKNTKAGPTILYFEQGAYEVRKNERGEKIVAPVSTDAVHVDTQRGLAVPAEAPRTLDEFKTDVQKVIRDINDRKLKMEMVRARKSEGPTIQSMILDNKLIIGALIIGLAVAAWQLFRR